MINKMTLLEEIKEIFCCCIKCYIKRNFKSHRCFFQSTTDLHNLYRIKSFLWYLIIFCRCLTIKYKILKSLNKILERLLSLSTVQTNIFQLFQYNEHICFHNRKTKNVYTTIQQHKSIWTSFMCTASINNTNYRLCTRKYLNIFIIIINDILLCVCIIFNFTAAVLSDI